jgi:hypothetical protein
MLPGFIRIGSRLQSTALPRRQIEAALGAKK